MTPKNMLLQALIRDCARVPMTRGARRASKTAVKLVFSLSFIWSARPTALDEDGDGDGEW